MQQSPSEIDVAAIAGQNRALTCAAAWWLQRLTLPSGASADGLRYASRHGVDMQCFALWVDLSTYPTGTPGVEATAEKYAISDTSLIEPDDLALQEAANALQLAVH